MSEGFVTFTPCNEWGRIIDKTEHWFLHFPPETSVDAAMFLAARALMGLPAAERHAVMEQAQKVLAEYLAEEEAEAGKADVVETED